MLKLNVRQVRINPRCFGRYFALEVLAGANIFDCLNNAKELAEALRIPIHFTHSNVELTVKHDSDLEALLEEWREKFPS